jgi:uncharacterized protein
MQGNDLKLVFTGPMGAGKTTAIAAISEIPPVSTDVANSDRTTVDKDTTTVALDYGQLTLHDGSILRLYGTPGQGRFSFMREILASGALGVIVLIDASRPDALRSLDEYLEAFLALQPKPQIVIGLGRHESLGRNASSIFNEHLTKRGHLLPIMTTDVRSREHVLMLIDTLMSMIETEYHDGTTA